MQNNCLRWGIELEMTEKCVRKALSGEMLLSCTYGLSAYMFSHVQLFATPWTVDYQAPLSMGFSRQEYWSAISSSRGSF